jgi:hypothetical protein
MAVYTTNLIIHTGTTFEQTFVLANSSNESLLNLTGYSVVSKMKKHGTSSNSTNLNASVSDATGGRVRLTLSASQTTDLTPGRYYYDIVLIKNGTNDRVVEGDVFVKKAVTR